VRRRRSRDLHLLEVRLTVRTRGTIKKKKKKKKKSVFPRLKDL